MSKQDNLAANDRLGSNINAGDLDTAMQTFATEAVDHDPAPDQGKGRAGFAAFFETMRSAFPDLHVEPEHVVADEDNVAFAYTLTGTHEGEFQGIAPTRKTFKIRGVQIGRFENGQIVERWGSSDELGLLSQLGVEPQPKSGLADKVKGALGGS